MNWSKNDVTALSRGESQGPTHSMVFSLSAFSCEFVSRINSIYLRRVCLCFYSLMLYYCNGSK